jgi:S1-C subfamily serine protease
MLGIFMILKVHDLIAENPPEEVKALIRLLGLTLQDDEYRQMVNRELQSLPRFQERKTLVERGFFSGLDFLQMLIACGSKGGASNVIADALMNRLKDWGLVSDIDLSMQNAQIRFMWNKPLIAQFFAVKVLDNVLLGPSYIAQKYRQSVPAIFVKKGKDEFTGTGFLTTNQPNSDRHFIVTAKHNVDPNDDIEFSGFSSPDGVDYKPLLSKWILHPSLDIAAMPVRCTEVPVHIYSVGVARVLSRTITLGYPRIATTADSYLLAHGGELNAIVTDYYNQKYLIISNAVAPGNSGGPVLDEAGVCVGMVVRAFETEHAGGVSTANAALPSNAILAFLSVL